MRWADGGSMHRCTKALFKRSNLYTRGECLARLNMAIARAFTATGKKLRILVLGSRVGRYGKHLLT